MDFCALNRAYTDTVSSAILDKTGIAPDHIIIACSHTHSGPAGVGYFNESEHELLESIKEKLVSALDQLVKNLKPVAVGCASGKEDTISHYRRFLDADGKVVMIWEQDPVANNLICQGEIDPEVGVLKVVDAQNPDKIMTILFNHAGHPNVMSGDNYMISADYPGVTQKAVEDEFGAVAMFVNGAQGTMDIDNWKYRDWEGMEYIGSTLAKAVSETAKTVKPTDSAVIRGSFAEYEIPARQVSDELLKWAEDIIEQTGGKVQPLADGVGDDYKALLYKNLRNDQDKPIQMKQICFAIGDTAFISFPGELFTEIGMQIKAESPFAHTYIIGLANGSEGYFPTRKAISQGGYEVDTRGSDDSAEEIIVEKSLYLLNIVYGM